MLDRYTAEVHKGLTTLRMTAPWKHPATGVYYFRRRVPARFTGVEGVPAGIIKWSLSTKEPKEAKRLWPEALAKWEAMEQGWERLANSITVTPGVAEEVAAAWVAAVASGRINVGGNTGDTRALALSRPGRRVRRREGKGRISADAALETATAAAEARTHDIVTLHTAEALSLAEIAIADEASPILYETMLRAVRAAYSQAEGDAVQAATRPLDKLRERLPDPPRPLASPRARQSLKTLFDAWKSVASVKPRTIAEAEYAIDALIAHLGHDDASKISKADLVRWRDGMKATGTSNNTWNNRHSLISQVLKRAVDDGRLPANPAESLRLAKAPTAPRFPYSDAEATQILTMSRQEKRASRRWAHWIMAFTGMRVGEVLQLSAADIQEDGGIHYFVVEGDTAGKSVKNGQRRHVPVHPALVAEGLIEYAKTLPASGPLFPDKGTDAHGLRGTRGWQAVGRWVREKVGITDGQKSPNHSWRHRVEDEFRAAGVDESLRDAILGHARKTVGRNYGIRGEALQRLYDAVSRIPVPPGLGIVDAGTPKTPREAA
jgi:integrase